MSAVTTEDALPAVASSAEAGKLYRSSEVSMILARRWQLACGRETLAKISDALGLRTRATPKAQRRWSLGQVEEVAAVLRLRQSDLLARGAMEVLLEARDHPAVRRLFEAAVAVCELPELGASTHTRAQTTAA